jgi:hypothetical protein
MNVIVLLSSGHLLQSAFLFEVRTLSTLFLVPVGILFFVCLILSI